MFGNRDNLELNRTLLSATSLSKGGFINALTDPFVIDELIKRGIGIGRDTDIDWRDIHLRPGDVVYVPSVDPKKLERYRRNGCYPKKSEIMLARYTFKGISRAVSKAETDALYGWRHHDELRRSPVRVDPRLLQMTERPEELTRIPVLDPDKVFFTADTHFFDERTLRHRPQFRDVDEMNDALARGWNETVPDDGIVFHLGDLLVGPEELAIRMVRQLNGTILLVKGNHDNTAVLRSYRMRRQTRLVYIGKERRVTIDGHKIEMNHYPYLCYAGQYGGVWQLFGHVHSGRSVEGFDLPRLANLLPFQYDVGVDNNGYRPVPFRRLVDIMSRRADFDFLAVRAALVSDIDEIRQIAADAIEVMGSRGNPDEWDGETFSEAVLRDDIAGGFGLTILQRNEVAGYFALVPGKEIPGTEELPWIHPERKFHTLERIVGLPEMHGVFHQVVGHCFSRVDNIRLATSARNRPMLNVLSKHYFTEIGHFLREDGAEMVAFQKIVEK